MPELDVKNLEFHVNAEWLIYEKKYPWLTFVAEEATDGRGNTYQRNKKKSDSLIYRKVGDGYACTNCGSEIEQTEVIHPVWDGPFPCSGSGQTAKEFVPYCPKCEKEPSSNGSPIMTAQQRRIPNQFF
mgnify:CR=1 FL=1